MASRTPRGHQQETDDRRHPTVTAVYHGGRREKKQRRTPSFASHGRSGGDEFPDGAESPFTSGATDTGRAARGAVGRLRVQHRPPDPLQCARQRPRPGPAVVHHSAAAGQGPLAVTGQPPSVAHQPPSVAHQPPSVAHQPPSVAPQPPSQCRPPRPPAVLRGGRHRSIEPKRRRWFNGARQREIPVPTHKNGTAKVQRSAGPAAAVPARNEMRRIAETAASTRLDTDATHPHPVVGRWCRSAADGGWRLVVGGGWRLAAVGLAVGGDWRLAVGSGWRSAVSGWRLAAGGWRLVVLGGRP